VGQQQDDLVCFLDIFKRAFVGFALLCPCFRTQKATFRRYLHWRLSTHWALTALRCLIYFAYAAAFPSVCHWLFRGIFPPETENRNLKSWKPDPWPPVPSFHSSPSSSANICVVHVCLSRFCAPLFVCFVGCVKNSLSCVSLTLNFLCAKSTPASGLLRFTGGLSCFAAFLVNCMPRTHVLRLPPKHSSKVPINSEIC